MVNIFSFSCHVIDRAYVSTDCAGGVGKTIKGKAGVSQACLGKSTSFLLDIHIRAIYTRKNKTRKTRLK